MKNTEKKCSGCEGTEQQEYQHSMEWEMMKELSKTIRRQYIIILTILALWFTTIFGFVWYLNQYDFSSYELSTDGGGNAYYNEQSGDGEINYGTDFGEETNSEEKSASEG